MALTCDITAFWILFDVSPCHAISLGNERCYLVDGLNNAGMGIREGLSSPTAS